MKGFCYELHYNTGTSVEYDDSAYELEEGDNPADNGDPIGGILEHVANNRWLVISDAR
jgi:hypothetical protein